MKSKKNKHPENAPCCVPRVTCFGSRQKGFTLAETVVYVGVFVVLSFLTINFILSLADSWGHGKAKRATVRTGAEATNRLAEEIRLASSVEIASSVLGVNPGHLVLDSFKSATSTAPETVEAYLTGAELFLKRGNDPAVSLSGDVAITRLVFNRLTSSTTDAIQINLTAEAGGTKYRETRNFQTLAILRGSAIGK